MNKIKNKLIAIGLSVASALTAFAVSAFATGEEETTQTVADQIAGGMTTALNGMKTDLTSILVTVLPVILGIITVVLLVVLGIKLYKKFTNKVG